MAFRKFAKAAVVKPDINFTGWDEVRHLATQDSLKFAFDSRKAAKVVLQEFSPKEFLLTHITIIASVDAEKSAAPLGKQIFDGFQIDRKYADWLITPDTSKYINNNNDAWERNLLLACFRTFIGGENYVEHIQIPEMSKGKIIDAAARDVGDSIYVDLLIATNRRHRPLISAISSNQLNTLSMGCQVEFTTCTKCGNVAYDETQLCNHIRYFKGNDWIDEWGKKRKIAELCGHLSEEPGSVKFIEASWVANPAFTGAVLRNILSAEEQEMAGVGQKMAIAFSEPPRISSVDRMSKAAFSLGSSIPKQSQEDPLAPGAPEDQAEKEKPKKDSDPISKAVSDLVDLLREKAIEKVRGEMNQDESGPVEENRNDSLIKSALKNPTWAKIGKAVLASVGGNRTAAKKLLLGMILYRSGGWKAVAASKALSGREILALSRLLDTAQDRRRVAGESRVYGAIVAVGGLPQDANEQAYLRQCREVMGRDISDSERMALITKGRLYALGL
jgi:hypothetical protein